MRLFVLTVFPAGNPVRTSPSSVTLSFPASDRPLIYELYNIRNGRYEKIREIPSTSQIQEIDVPVQPGLRYRFTVRSLDANQRNLASPLSTPLDVTAPGELSVQWIRFVFVIRRSSSLGPSTTFCP